MLVSLPLVLLVLDVYPLRRLDLRHWRGAAARRLLLEKAPYLALALVTMAITSMTMRASIRVTPLTLYPPAARVAMAAYGLAWCSIRGRRWPRSI